MSDQRCRFRNQWIMYLAEIGQQLTPSLMDQGATIDQQQQSNRVANQVKDFLILTQLAHQEIDSDDLEPNKALAKGNLGIDCADMIAQSLIMNAQRMLPANDFQSLQEECVALVPLFLSNQVNESMLSTFNHVQTQVQQVQ